MIGRRDVWVKELRVDEEKWRLRLRWPVSLYPFLVRFSADENSSFSFLLFLVSSFSHFFFFSFLLFLIPQNLVAWVARIIISGSPCNCYNPIRNNGPWRGTVGFEVRRKWLRWGTGWWTKKGRLFKHVKHGNEKTTTKKMKKTEIENKERIIFM